MQLYLKCIPSFYCEKFADGYGNRCDCCIQPELRRALEKLGEKQFLTSVVPFEQNREIRFSEETRENIIRACFAMGKVKTGALIVVEQAIRLTEYESTGIQMDCLVSSQVLENIFEHNTPLHDGAIIIRGDRIVSATCYLPLSDNMRISKDLGTRHRAAVGMSEVSDARSLLFRKKRELYLWHKEANWREILMKRSLG